MTEITITIDVDWAPEEMIEDTLLLLEEYKVKATFFCTHKSPLLLSQKEHELAIHPNFVPLIEGTSKKTKEQIVEELLEIYPSAKGVRAHGLVQSSGIMQLYIDKGLTYDSNMILPYQKLDKYVYDTYDGFKRNVYNFEDDLIYKTHKPFAFNNVIFEYSPIIICDFHPFLVFNNISSNAEYEYFKRDYQNVKLLKSKRCLDKVGIRNVFIDAIRLVKCADSGTLVKRLF